MSYRVKTIPYFDKQAKRLAKKYPSLKSDLATLITSLLKDPFQGISLGKNCYKIRMAVKSKGKGKSGGMRIIFYVFIDNEDVYLLSIYDKSDQNDIPDNLIKELLNQLK